MEQRVDEREWIQFQWPYLMAWLGGEELVNALAYRSGAFSRRRGIQSPAQMLQLLLTWAVAERSLRETAALASEAEMAEVSNVALMKRFARAGEWIGALLGEVMKVYAVEPRVAVRVRLLDASSIQRRGSRGTDARLHMRLDLATNRFDAIELTDAKGGETVERFTFTAGEIVIADRGYARRADLAAVVRQGANFIIRLPWSNVPLEQPDGTPFDLLGALRELPEAEAGEFAVAFRSPNGERIGCRLVAIRKSEPAAAAERRRLAREKSKRGTSADARTFEAAGYVFVLTNVPSTLSAQTVLDLYRLRWQIEMKFKTLKSVLHLGNIPVRSTELLQVYVLAKLLVAVLIDQFIETAESFSPWGYPLPASELVATD